MRMTYIYLRPNANYCCYTPRYETLGLDHGYIVTNCDTFSSYILPVKPFCYSLQRTCSMYKWPRLVLCATTAHAVTIIVLGSTMRVHIRSLP